MVNPKFLVINVFVQRWFKMKILKLNLKCFSWQFSIHNYTLYGRQKVLCVRRELMIDEDALKYNYFDKIINKLCINY